MKNKRLIEILILTRTEFEVGNSKYSKLGMCNVLKVFNSYNIITTLEYREIMNFLYRNMPTSENKYKKFTESELWYFPTVPNVYWWNTISSNPLGNQIRIDYLTALINDNTNIINKIIWKLKGL